MTKIFFLMLIPESLAASRLPPTAYEYRPSLVLVVMYEKIMATTTMISTGLGNTTIAVHNRDRHNDHGGKSGGPQQVQIQGAHRKTVILLKLAVP